MALTGLASTLLRTGQRVVGYRFGRYTLLRRFNFSLILHEKQLHFLTPDAGVPDDCRAKA